MADGQPVTLDMSTAQPISGSGDKAPSSGVTLDMSTAQPIPQQTTPPPQRGFLENLVGGVEKGASETVQGGMNLLGRGVEIATGQPKGSLQATRQETEAPSVARSIGSGVEQVGEFAAGDELLKGLTKMGQIPESYLALAEKYPKIAKILLGGAKGAVVGGVQGAVHGAADEKAGEGAVGGAVGGGVGGLVGETATELAGELGKRFGIGTTAIEDATRGAKPGKRNVRFADDFQTAAPLLDAEHSISPNQTVEDWADAADNARKKIWNQKVEPLVARHATVPLGGINIKKSMDATMRELAPTMTRFSPAEAAKVEQLANQFLPGQVFALNVGDAEEALEHMNAELSKTGYWSKLPSERAALLKTDGTILGYKAAADAIRDELYGKLGELEPQSDMAALKKQYGALRNVGNEIRGQVNVAGRQSPVSLKETIGLITGLAHGGATGGVVAALPFVDRAVNSPEKLIGRAVQKAARPEASTVGKAVAAGGRKIADLTAPAGAAIGQSVAEGQPANDRVTFTASDGSVHSVPANQIQEALKVDPKLVITNQ